MKKLLLLLFGLTSLSCCKRTHESLRPDTDHIVESSLNGFSEVDTKTRVSNFASNTNATHANTQVWISLTLLKKMSDLLTDDATNGAVVPNGIRIYFSSTSSVAASAPSDDQIIVVSTYKSGVNELGVQVNTDYFEHSKSFVDAINVLISQGDPHYKIFHDSDHSNGAILFDPCNNCDITHPCIVTSGHDIKHSVARKLVKHFSDVGPTVTAVWFDINMLNNLVSEMPNENDDGIRIYFARNIDTTGADQNKEEFVIATTQLESGTGNHKDYFDCRSPITPPIPPSKNNFASQENGEICPSNCDGVSKP